MTETVASKVYPTILYVLELLERINNKQGPEPTPQEEFPILKAKLNQLNQKGSEQKEFELCKQALVYWVDEVLVNSTWSHAMYWKDHTLEREFYDSRDRAWEFFEKAKIARSLRTNDSLETFYLCVALGFVGLYRDGQTRAAEQAAAAAAAGKIVAPEPAPSPPPANPETWAANSFFDVAVGDQKTPGLPKAGQKHAITDDSFFINRAAGQLAQPQTGGAQSMWDASIGGSSVVKGPMGMGRDLPKTLLEWAAPVYSQLVPGQLRSFQPASPAESQRDANSLKGWRRLARSFSSVFWMTLLTISIAGFYYYQNKGR